MQVEYTTTQKIETELLADLRHCLHPIIEWPQLSVVAVDSVAHTTAVTDPVEELVEAVRSAVPHRGAAEAAREAGLKYTTLMGVLKGTSRPGHETRAKLLAWLSRQKAASDAAEAVTATSSSADTTEADRELEGAPVNDARKRLCDFIGGFTADELDPVVGDVRRTIVDLVDAARKARSSSRG